MSYRPTIGGKLREETSGVDRSQAGCYWWGLDPEKEIGQTCGLNVIMRRTATSNRSVVTAAKLVYSTWKFTQPGERNGKAIYRDRSASQSVHLLHSIGERPDLVEGVGLEGSGAVCEGAAGRRRSGRGDHGQHTAVSRRGGPARKASRGSGYQSVSSHQSIREENRSERRAAAVFVSIEESAAGRCA